MIDHHRSSLHIYVSWTYFSRGQIGNFTLKFRSFVQIPSVRKRSIHLRALMQQTDKNLYLFSLRLSLKIKEVRIGVETIDVKILNLNLRVLKSRKYMFGGFAFFVAFTITLNDVLFHPGSFSLRKRHVVFIQYRKYQKTTLTSIFHKSISKLYLSTSEYFPTSLADTDSPFGG